MRKILWLLFACAAMLVAASGCAEDGQILLLNDRAAIPAGQTLVFSFSPTANNLYDLATFGGETHGILELDGETLFDTEGFSQRARLIAGEVYKLTVTAKEEDAVLEIMRASLGRCYNEPVQITDFAAGYDKVIARAYDTHWYRFVAPTDGYYAFRTVSDIDTVGYLLDERGSEIAQNDDLKAPYSLDFRIETALKQGETCYLRISAHDGETGAYHLTIRILEKENLPVEEIAFSDRSMELRAGESASVHLDGDPTKNDPVFMTLDSSIAVINESGVISAVSAGATTVFIAGLNGTGDRMRVFVEPAPVEAIVPDAEIIDLHPGQSENLAFQVLPREAGDAELIYLSSDLSVVSVDMDGQVTALKEGVADVTILSGEVSAAVRVRVLPAPPVYRALLVGEQGYAGSDLRLGAVNTTQGIYDLLSQQDYDSGSYRTTMRIDLSAKELILAIRSAFSDCAPSDISLFYINCHGELRDGRPVLKMHDGSVVTVRALYKALSRVKGRIILLIDCCNSGGFISSSDSRRFSSSLIQTFSAGTAAAFARSKYCLLTSASRSGLSYRIGRGDSESATSTAFSYYLALAGGWDLIRDKPRRLRADADGNGVVTLHEAWFFISAQVNQIMTPAGYRQDVQIWPRGSSFPLFSE